MNRILITGVAGFVGSHLAEYLLENCPKAKIYGTILPTEPLDNILHIKDKLELRTCDINNYKEIFGIIQDVLPDTIFHLAAQSYVHSSWENPENTLKTNIIGQSNLLEAARLLGEKIDPIILISCSSEEYGYASEKEIPIKETNELRPRSPYAVSKVAQDYMGYQYWQAYGMKIIRKRAFNHTGPRRAPVFFVSGFAKKIAEIEKGLRPPELEVRDLSAIRDFSDVRDIVRGYALAVEKCKAGDVYNICSGKGLRLQEIVDALVALSKTKHITLKKDPEGKRPNDGGIIVGDYSKFQKASGWNPEIDFLKKTLPDMLEWWRKKI